MGEVREIAIAWLVVVLALATWLALAKPYDVHAFVWARATIANNGSSPFRLKPVKIPLPANETPYQLSYLSNVTVRLGGVSIACQTSQRVGECGSAYLVVECPGELPPRSTLEVEVVVEVFVRRFEVPPLNYSSSGTVNEIPESLRLLTASEGPWRYGDPWMRYLADAAARVASGERRVLSIVARLVDFVWRKVNYEVGFSPRYPNETLPPDRLEVGRGRGDCDDQANLLILMLRSLDVPAYLKTALVVDFNYGERRVIWEQDLHYYYAFSGVYYAHAWAEVYVPPWGWLPVDLTFNSMTGDPLDAIRTSVTSKFWAWRGIVTIRLGNVRHSDYIDEFKREVANLARSSLYYYKECAVVKKGDSLERVKRLLPPLPLPWVRQTEIEVSCPSRARALERLRVSGTLRPGVENATVLILVKKPSKQTLTLEARTRAGGAWEAEVELDEAGAWSFNVAFPGSPGYAPSSREVTLHVEKLPSELKLELSQLDSKVTVKGWLRPPLNTTITLIVSAPGGHRSSMAANATNGHFELNVTALLPGDYAVTALWTGTKAYEGSLARAHLRVELPTSIKITKVELEGGSVVVEGVLHPAIEANVTVEARGAAGVVRQEAVVSRNGTFSARLQLQPGEWEIAVSFPGGGGYKPSSATARISVPAPLPLAQGVAAALAALAALLALVYLRKRRGVGHT